MLLIKLKSRFCAEVIKVFAISVDKVNNHYSIELAMVTDTDKMEAHGFEPNFEILTLTAEEFFEYVVHIGNVG